MVELRSYQKSAIRRILSYAKAHPTGRLLVVVPPRGGKTHIGATVARRFGISEGELWIAHRRELIAHARDHLVECGVPSSKIGTIMAGVAPDPSALVQVASVDTLTRRHLPRARLIISDESHRDAAEGRRKLRGAYPDAFKLGLTGTPCRSDGRGLAEDFDEMMVVTSPSDLIAAGYLAAPRIFTVPTELLPKLGGVHVRRGDFDQAELDSAVNRKSLIGSIVEHWKRLAKNRRTLVFPVSIKHSLHIVEQFRAAGVKAAHVDGATPSDQRAEIVLDLRAGALRVVSSCGVFSEGVDLPEVKCAILARPTQSLALHIQQSSRPLTPWQNVKPLILDHAGNMVRRGLGLPHADREWSLNEGDAAGAGAATGAKICGECFAIVDWIATVCPECGHKFREIVPVLSETTDKLREIEIAEETARISAFAAKRKLPAEWVKKVVQAKFGTETAR